MYLFSTHYFFFILFIYLFIYFILFIFLFFVSIVTISGPNILFFQSFILSESRVTEVVYPKIKQEINNPVYDQPVAITFIDFSINFQSLHD